MQGCKLVGDAACGYLLSLQGLLGVRLSFAEAAAGGSNSSKAVSGSLVLLPQDAAGAGAGAPAQDMLKMQLLREMGECHNKQLHTCHHARNHAVCAWGCVCCTPLLRLVLGRRRPSLHP